MRTKRDEKKNEALVVVVEPSIDQKISNTGHKFNRLFFDRFCTKYSHVEKEKEQKKVSNEIIVIIEFDEKETNENNSV
jgi:hypothetical protein